MIDNGILAMGIILNSRGIYDTNTNNYIMVLVFNRNLRDNECLLGI